MLLASWFSSSAYGMAASLSDDNVQKVLMCTQNGYEWVSINFSEEPQSNNTSHNQHCVFCFLSDADDLITDAGQQDKYYSKFVRQTASVWLEPLKVQTPPPSQTHSRAPPQ